MNVLNFAQTKPQTHKPQGPIYAFSRKPKNSIEWTGQERYNTISGCQKISPGCKFCYAERVALKLQAEGKQKYSNAFKPTLHPYVINQPYRWPSNEICFVDSMSDMFQATVPKSHLDKVFKVMNALPQHQWQLLTKRSERMKQLVPHFTWTDNIWAGVSVENEDYLFRIDDLRTVPAKIRFISFEPLIGPIPTGKINLTGIHWVIIGGESGGSKVRPMELKWVRDIIKACDEQEIPVFFKQCGRHLGQQLGMTNKYGSVDSKGGDDSKFPTDLRRWEFPIDMRPYLHCFSF